MTNHADPNRQLAEFVAQVNGWPILDGYNHSVTVKHFVRFGNCFEYYDGKFHRSWQPLTDANQMKLVKQALCKKYWIKIVIGQHSTLIYAGSYDNAMETYQAEKLGDFAEEAALAACVQEIMKERKSNGKTSS